MKREYNAIWELSCRVRDPIRAELIIGVLGSLGYPVERIARVQTGHGQRIIAFFDTAMPCRQFQQKLRSLGLRGVSFDRRLLRKQDWQDKWKQGIKPFGLTPRIRVVPAWAQARPKNARRKSLFIDTNLAFGTGLHETTRFMAQLIEGQRARVTSLLDVGTGTGILAIVAFLSGIRDITAIDMDPNSVRVARRNFRANKVTGVTLKVADIKDFNPARPFDYVAANLISQDLVLFARQLVSLVGAGKFLAVSGISLKNLGSVRREFKRFAVKERKVLRGKTWAAILYQKDEHE